MSNFSDIKLYIRIHLTNITKCTHIFCYSESKYINIYIYINAPQHCVEHSRGRILTSATYTLYIYNIYDRIYIYILYIYNFLQCRLADDYRVYAETWYHLRSHAVYIQYIWNSSERWMIIIYVDIMKYAYTILQFNLWGRISLAWLLFISVSVVLFL